MGASTRGRTLRKNSISLVGATVLSLASISPVTGLAIFPPLLAGLAGPGFPFVMALAGLGVLCVALTIAQFARWIQSAGSFYAFNSAGLGPIAGYLSGWMLLFTYFIVVPANLLVVGVVGSDFVARQWETDLPWWAMSLAVAVVVTALALAGIRSSTRVDLVLLAAELLVVIGLGLAIVTQGGDSGNEVAVLTPAHTSLDGNLSLALGFSFLVFVGFEVAYTASEETRNAHRNTAVAMASAVVMAALIFVFISYAMVIGFGLDHMDDLAADPLALGTLAGRYTSPSYAVLIEAAIVVALLSATVGILNGLVRVIFALARDGLLPRQLAEVNPRRRTPDAAIIAASCVSVVIVLGLGLSVGPFPEGVSYLAAVATLPVLVLYGSASVSVFRYVRRHHPDDFRAVPHVLVPALGILIIGLALYGAYHPFPHGTVLYLNILFLGYVAVGVVLARRWAHRRSQSVPQFAAGLEASPDTFDELDPDA